MNFLINVTVPVNVLRGEAPHLLPTTLVVMHLKSSKISGLSVPSGAFDDAYKFLNECKVPEKGKNFFGWQPGEKVDPKATIFGCLALQFLGTKREELRKPVQWAISEIRKNKHWKKRQNALLLWIATLGVFQHGGKMWKEWNSSLKAEVNTALITDGPKNGSWKFYSNKKEPPNSLGPTGTTALTTLCLEVCNRYSSIYR